MKNVNQGKETPNPETKKVEEGDTANHFPNPKKKEERQEERTGEKTPAEKAKTQPD